MSLNQKKILYPNIKNTTAFHLDRENFYHIDTIHHIIGGDLAYIVAILNSDAVHWYLGDTVSMAKGDSLRLFESHMRHVPIPQIGDDARLPFIDLAERLTDLHGHIEAARRTFLDLRLDEFGLETPAAKLRDWPAHGFRGLRAALKRAGHNLSGPREDNWFDRFTRRKTEIEDLRRQAAAAQTDLNRRVNALYGLIPAEIAMIATARN